VKLLLDLKKLESLGELEYCILRSESISPQLRYLVSKRDPFKIAYCEGDKISKVVEDNDVVYLTTDKVDIQFKLTKTEYELCKVN
jgi:hypothetical protein